MTLLDELQRRNVPLQLPRREIDIRILLRVFAGVKDESRMCRGQNKQTSPSLAQKV